MKQTKLALAAGVFAVAALPTLSFAQHHNLTHDQDATQDAVVQFGVNPNTAVPLGPPPCAQLLAGGAPNVAIGGPADPCQYKLHHLNNDTEVTIFKGGQVRFTFGGGGHALAIYEVSKDTTRQDIGSHLCAGFDRTFPGPSVAGQPCNLDAVNSAANHIISDGKDDVVIISGVNNDPANAPPINQVSYEPGRLMSDSAAGNATIDSYRFLKTGRYLVICKNRTHLLNDWMFTFVNVVGGD